MIPTLLAIAFKMPGDDALISLMLLLLVLGFCFWLATRMVTADPWRTVVTAIAILILIVIVLRTFTTWGG